MSVGKISELVDESALAQLDTLYQKLGISTQAMVEATAQAAKYNAEIGNVRTISEFNQANQQAVSSMQNVVRAQQEVVTTQQQAATATAQVADQVKAKAIAEVDASAILRKLGGDIEANIKLLIEQKIELSQVTEQLKTHSKAMGDSVNSQVKNIETTSQLTKQQLLLKEAIAQNTLTIRQQTKEQLAAETSNNIELAQLNQLIKLQNTLSKEEREQTVAGQQLQASIDKLRASTVEANQMQGKFNDNVGNYPGKANEAAVATEKVGKSFDFTGRLANVLTSRLFRMAGSFLLITVALGALEWLYKWVAGLDVFTGRLNQALQNFNAWNEAMKDADRDSGKAVGSLKILYDATQDVTLSMEDRLAAAKELQKLYPDQFDASRTQALLNGEEKKSYEELTQAIIENARADAAKVKIQQLESQIIDEEFKKQKIRNAESNELSRVNGNVSASAGTGGGGAGGTTTEAQQRNNIKVRAELAQKDADAQISIYKGQVDFLEKTIGLKRLAKSVEDDDKTKDKKAKADKLWEYDYELAKAQLKLAKDTAKETLDNDKQSYGARLVALQVYIDKSNALIDLEQKAKNRKPGITATEVKTNAVTAQDEKLGVTAFNKSELSKLDKEQLDAHRKDLQDLLALEKDFADQTLAVLQQSTNDQLQLLDEQKNREETVLANKYAKGIIDEKQYRKELLRIADQYNIDRLGAIAFQEQSKLEVLQAKETSDVNDTVAFGGTQKDVDEVKSKSGVAQQKNVVSKAGINLQDAINKQTQDNAKGDAKDNKEVDFATKVGYLQQIQDDASKIIQANYENEISLLEKRKQLIDDTANAEITRVNNSVLSSKEKAREEAIIREQAKQQQIQVDAQISKIKERQAKYDRAMSIANIIENTAVAISKTLAEAAIFGIPLVPIIAALGAAQVAAVLAAPLPKFERGGTVGKDGHIITGEAGTELRIDPSGKMSLTAPYENVTYAKAGTKIISNKELMRIVGKPEPVYYVSNTGIETKRIEKLLAENNDLTRKAKQQIRVNVHQDRWGTYSANRNY